MKENYFHTFTYAEQSHFTILRYFLHSGFKAICISGSHIFRKYRNNLGSLEIYINVNSFVRKSSLVQIPLSAGTIQYFCEVLSGYNNTSL